MTQHSFTKALCKNFYSNIAVFTFATFVAVGIPLKLWAQKVIVKANDKHSYQGLKLKGDLKKPELSYIYKRKGLRQEQILSIPTDFDSEIIHDTRKF